LLQQTQATPALSRIDRVRFASLLVGASTTTHRSCGALAL
jgi:hypothetical protein